MNKSKFSNLKIAVIGLGSIGERHLYNLKHLGFKDVIVCDSNKTRANFISKKYSFKQFYDLDSCLNTNPNTCLICTFPDSHSKIASKCIKNNSHVFIEKPLSVNLKNIKTILKLADQKKLKVGVGYNLRFDKGLNFLRKQILQKHEIPVSLSSYWGLNIKLWNKGKNFKNHYALKKSGGIILDDSHEYDLMRWLLNDEVKSVFCHSYISKNLNAKSESSASLILKFRKGTIATLVIDYLRPTYERGCNVIFENKQLSWNYKPMISPKNKFFQKAQSNIMINNLKSKNWSKKFQIYLNDMYLDELMDYFSSIINETQPRSNGWDSLKTLQVGLSAIESYKKNKPIILPTKF